MLSNLEEIGIYILGDVALHIDPRRKKVIPPTADMRGTPEWLYMYISEDIIIIFLVSATEDIGITILNIT